MWFNNFVEFERKQNRPNRLILNLYRLEDRKKVKAFVKLPVRIPTDFLRGDKVQEVELDVKSNPELAQFPFSTERVGNYFVSSITMPHEKRLIDQLHSKFQTGDYDKLLRLRGFFPERKANLNAGLEKLFEEKDEVELDSLDGIHFTDFITEDELSALPSLYIDIEKPLWKKEDEKELLDEREHLLKLERKYQKQKVHNQEEEIEHNSRTIEIGDLEKKLTIQLEGVGEVKLYDPRFNADVSFITTIWKDRSKEIKEMFVLDPLNEINYKDYKGYQVLAFKTEKELITALIDKLHERKPVISYGHNQVYDITQLRFASEDHDLTFDPAIKEVKPRRDFTRKFLQRLREDMIYIDSLWLSNIISPYLKQRRFGSSLKLASVAQHRGIDFKKSLTHEQLREVELKRLAGVTLEIRKQSINQMLFYARDDVDNTKGIIDSINPLPFLIQMKQIFPFCTLSEIAFSSNCAAKTHEYLHFKRAGNLPYHGYKAKERQDEEQIFKKRFPALKAQRLKRTSNFNKQPKGEYDNIEEHYLSLEEALSPIAFSIYPLLRKIYGGVRSEALKNPAKQELVFGYLQYLRSFISPMLVDYYFVGRDKSVYQFSRDFLIKNNVVESEKQLFETFNNVESNVNFGKLDKLKWSFRFLKNHFRSIYVPLKKEGRALIRPRTENLAELEFPEIAENDVDLYLLRKNAGTIMEQLTGGNRTTLKSFLTNFRTFENSVDEISAIMGLDTSEVFDPLYSYVYRDRYAKGNSTFKARYHLFIEDLNKMMTEAYSNLRDRLKGKGRVIDFQGDYLFIDRLGQDAPLDIPFLHQVRQLKKYQRKN